MPTLGVDVKNKRPGRPASISTRAAISHIHSIAPSSRCKHGRVYFSLHKSAMSSMLKAVGSSSAAHNLQQSCVHELFHLQKSKLFICPCCSSDHIQDFTTIVQPSSVVTSVLDNVKVTCTLCNKCIVSGKCKVTTYM